jgi:DNA-binding NarL/FixJ family response regulator
MKRTKIRVLCVDDHRIVRDGIALIVGKERDMEVTDAVATGEDAIEVFTRTRPDIVLMDLQLKTMSGLQAIQGIRHVDSAARIIVLTMYEGDERIFRALDAGATTYLLKDSLSDDLISVIRHVHAGERPLQPDIQATLDQRAAHPGLTPREIQVMQLVAAGQRNKEIAAHLAISAETVQVHLKNIFSKLKVSDRTAALSAAVRRGIVDLS